MKFIAFDLGAESGRCFTAEVNSEKLQLNEVHRFPTHIISNNTGLYWDVMRIYSEILTGLQNAVNFSGKIFNGIAVTTWGVDYVLIDKHGEILGNPFHYRDSRTDGMMEKAFYIVPAGQLYAATGNQPAQYNTLFQLLAEKKNNAALLNKSDKMLLMPDFFSYLLTGSKYSEYTIASTTGLTDPYKRDWSSTLIETFALPENIFPDIVEPGTKAGMLKPSISAECGLAEGIPVYAAAAHDTASVFASFPLTNNSAFLSSGTWSLLGTCVTHPFTNIEAMKAGFTNEGGASGNNYLLKNIIGLWPLQECRKHWLNEGYDISYRELSKLAEDYGPSGAWLNLDDIRFLKPGNMPGKIYSFLAETGQRVNNEKGFITRVIFESLAYCYRNTLKEIEKVTGKKIECLYASGGGIKNEFLTRLLADAADLKVYAGPVEGAVMGNVAVQAIAAGVVPDINAFRNLKCSSSEIKVYEPAGSGYFNSNEEKYNKVLSISEPSLP